MASKKQAGSTSNGQASEQSDTSIMEAMRAELEQLKQENTELHNERASRKPTGPRAPRAPRTPPTIDAVVHKQDKLPLKWAILGQAKYVLDREATDMQSREDAIREVSESVVKDVRAFLAFHDQEANVILMVSAWNYFKANYPNVTIPRTKQAASDTTAEVATDETYADETTDEAEVTEAVEEFEAATIE